MHSSGIEHYLLKNVTAQRLNLVDSPFDIIQAILPTVQKLITAAMMVVVGGQLSAPFIKSGDMTGALSLMYVGGQRVFYCAILIGF